MRKSILYIISFVIINLMFSCSQEKKTDWRVTFDKNSKDPYGCYIAYHLLKDIFPETKIESGRNIFKEINSSLDKPQLASSIGRMSIVVCKRFEADSLELDKMLRYIKKGNTILIFAENYSKNIFSYFHAESNTVYSSIKSFSIGQEDTIENQKTFIFFNHRKYQYLYSGLPVQYDFTIDSTYDEEIYYLTYSNSIDTPSSLISSDEEGTFMICRNPITMTNHFLLQNNNRNYFEYLMSFFSSYHSHLTWYSTLERNARDETEVDWSWLINFPPLFYAFLMLATLFLFYTLFEGKRRQRSIPILPSNTNSSLEFTETVGLLYFNKKDNRNLSEKMITHYLENIRTKHNLKTNEMDQDFVIRLAQRTNHSFEETNAFMAYLQYIRDSATITDIDIQHLYHQLQKFI